MKTISETGIRNRSTRFRGFPISHKPHNQSSGSTYYRGFTLLELLLVVFILSLIISVAVPRLVQDNPEDLLMEEARRLGRKLELATQEATFRNLQLGMLVNMDEYRFFQFETDKWTPLDDDILKPYRLKKGVEIKLSVEGFPQSLETKQTGDKPQIAILSNGEFTPFELRFIHSQNRDNQVMLQVNPLGEIKLELVKSP